MQLDNLFSRFELLLRHKDHNRDDARHQHSKWGRGLDPETVDMQGLTRITRTQREQGNYSSSEDYQPRQHQQPVCCNGWHIILAAHDHKV
jgi:hypothetical protein